MSARTLLVTLLALVCGGSAAIGINMFLNARPAKAETETVPVLVALIDIERATTITADHIATRDWPKDLVPPDALSKLDEIIGRTTLERIVKNEPMMESKLATKGSGEGITALVTKGMRGKTIMTRDAAALGGAQPGSRVDIYFTMMSNLPGSGGVLSGVILENIEVLAVGHQYQKNRDRTTEIQTAPSVMLHVNPSEGRILDVAMARGTLSLAIRNPLDTAPSNAPLISLEELLRLPAREEKAPAPPPPPAPEPKKEVVKEPEDEPNHKMEIIQGGKVDRIEFQLPKKPKKEEKKPTESPKPDDSAKPAGNGKAPEPAKETGPKSP